MGNVLGRGEEGTCLYGLGVVGILEREKPVEKTGDRRDGDGKVCVYILAKERPAADA